MTPRQELLFDHHKDTARLMCGKGDVFWVLDLEDPEAFLIAVAMDPAEDKHHVADSRDSILATGCIPSQTALTPYPLACAMIANGWDQPPPPPEGRYMAIVSDGRLLVATVKPLTNSP
jgi:hypothetical protein